MEVFKSWTIGQINLAGGNGFGVGERGPFASSIFNFVQPRMCLEKQHFREPFCISKIYTGSRPQTIPGVGGEATFLFLRFSQRF